MMTQNIWVVICGQARNLFELAYTLHIVLAARRRGTIQGVVLSTWLGERSKAESLFAAAENDGVLIVESRLPWEWSQQPSHFTSPAYQALVLHRALEIIPNDAYVLKTRTDLIPDITAHLLAILEQPQHAIGRDALLDKQRLTACHINNVLFFDINDTHYFVHRSKLIELLDFSVLVDASANPHAGYFVPEVRFFGQGYMRRYRHLSFLISIIDIPKYMPMPLYLCSSKNYRFSKLLVKAYAIYYKLLLDNFQLCWQSEPPSGKFRFHDLFMPNGSLCGEPYRDGCALIRSDAKLRWLATATPDLRDKAAVRFLDLLAGQMTEVDDHIDRDDVEELIACNDALPQERRFLALSADEIRARVPRPLHRQEFHWGDTRELRHRECSGVFIREIEQGRLIAHAAYAAYRAAADLVPERAAETRFWLEMAAHYGHEAAQLEANIPSLDFTDLRRRREAWLEDTFQVSD
jgi:hypothetical protein